jgi:hypothetical protein
MEGKAVFHDVHKAPPLVFEGIPWNTYSYGLPKFPRHEVWILLPVGQLLGSP